MTGASGFLGRWVLRSLTQRGVPTRAVVESPSQLAALRWTSSADVLVVDTRNRAAVLDALEGIDVLYHCAERTDPREGLAALRRGNVDVTRTWWECAAERSVPHLVFCSNAAVYGLLARQGHALREDEPLRAVEPYGASKREAEEAVAEVSERRGLSSVVVRPSALFGPGGHSPFAHDVRGAAHSRLFLAGPFRHKTFSYVHVEDVAEAAIHLSTAAGPGTRAFNVTAPLPISFEDAFAAYVRALRRSHQRLLRARALAHAAGLLHRAHRLERWAARIGGSRITFPVWRAGFDLTFSAEELLRTSYSFRWTGFEEILLDAIDGQDPLDEQAWRHTATTRGVACASH